MPGKNVPFPPMEAQLVNELPLGDNLQYEPKWDGFRGVLENDGGELALWSRNGRPLLRYFPELADLGERLPPHSALDGEIVIEHEGRLEFDLLQMRLHPAESRVRKLAAEHPARFVCFDMLLWKGEPVWQEPLAKRRKRVEKLPFDVSAASRDPEQARAWLASLDAIGLDGVIAKRLDSPYLPGSRDAVQKVKEHRSAECVVVGVRWKAKPTQLATLLLGLYEKDGRLDYVGSCAVAAGKQKEILALVKPLLAGAPERGFSEQNRWGTGGLEESALRPELVVEVRYDKVQGNRFRHGTRLLRFRADKDASECTWEQVRPKRRRNDPTVEKLLGTT
ncbi:MAG TPA: ATP-dependent DNA ligase [Gaiellaceae bacterium]|jgi:ATP-dependent DNA ligase|nr:ATP-dependent DNA ligase [Gaiellaceae bacterium]